MNREEAQKILQELTDNPSLLRHAHSVELVMQHYARKFNEDEEEWAITGMLQN